MKLSYKSTITNINFFALLLFVFWLPLNDEFKPAILAFWIFTWLLEGNFKTRFKNFPNKLIYLSLAFFIFLYIFSLLYTDNIDYGLFEIQRKLSIVFFPILIIGSNLKIKENKNTILFTFVIANLFASIYLLSNAFFSNLIIENGSWYIKHWHWAGTEKDSFWKLVNLRHSNFSYGYVSIFLHPSYFAMYIVFSITIVFYFFKQQVIKSNKIKVLSIFTVLLFIFMIYLLQARAGFITFIVVFLIVFITEFKKNKNKKIIALGIIVLFISTTVVLSSSRMQQVFYKLKDIPSSKNKIELIKLDTRFQTWYAATRIIKENFFFGTAPSDVYKELMEKYVKYNFKAPQINSHNAHNQYLETFAGLGIIGFVSLMSILIAGFIFAYKNKHYLMFFLLLILSINFLFESMLNRMAGVLFMMIFYSMFVFGDIKHTHFNTYKNNK